VVRGSSLHNRGATSIRIDYTQLRIPNHTTYAGPKPTYINLHSDPPKPEWVRATQEHSTPLTYCQPRCFCPSQIRRAWVHATLVISPLLVRGCLSHNRIDEVSGLPEYVASCKVSTTHMPTSVRSLIDTNGTSTTRQPDRLNHQRQFPYPARSLINPHSSLTINIFHEYRIIANDENTIQLLIN
jgi:hypothetical protein